MKVNQSRFAKILGFSRSAVTQLKNAGRLVIDADGLVDVEASKERIKATADPNRDDVARRHAERRGEKADDDGTGVSHGGASYQSSRALKERYLALQAKIDYQMRIGELVERAEVERDWVNVATILRTSFERLPDSLSGVLSAESDQARIHAILSESVEMFLKQASEQISKQK